jgi:hypothetical protein
MGVPLWDGRLMALSAGKRGGHPLLTGVENTGNSVYGCFPLHSVIQYFTSHLVSVYEGNFIIRLAAVLHLSASCCYSMLFFIIAWKSSCSICSWQKLERRVLKVTKSHFRKSGWFRSQEIYCKLQHFCGCKLSQNGFHLLRVRFFEKNSENVFFPLKIVESKNYDAIRKCCSRAF